VPEHKSARIGAMNTAGTRNMPHKQRCNANEKAALTANNKLEQHYILFSRII